MANKRCPVCGKSIAAQAHYCIYCSTKFDSVKEQSSESVEETHAVTPKKYAFGLIVTLISLVLIAIVVLLVLFGPVSPLFEQEEPAPSVTTTVTTTTRNAALDAQRQSYIGYWYDEYSAGKRDHKTQGGYVLYIAEIFHDYVTFDLLSYQGFEGGAIASATIEKAVLNDDTLHFTFDNDTLGHKGEGFLRLAEDCIQMEVMIDGELAQAEHSLAVNAVFLRRALPASEGQNVQELTTLNALKAVAGPQTAEMKTDEKGLNTYTFRGVKAVADKNGSVKSIRVDYSALEKKDGYCYDCVDGTMTYDVIKAYFGEALHDYVEQPTDIRVLHYALSATSAVTFTFDADSNLLIGLQYVL